MNIVDINGISTAILDIGPGPRTLVTHGGFIGDIELWRKPAEILSERGWRVIAYDHRGSGASTASAEDIGIDQMVDDLFAVLDHCGVEQCVVAGESMGSIVVQRAAVRDPERFSHVVLVAGAARFPATPPLRLFKTGLRHTYRATIESFVWMCMPERGASKELRELGREMGRKAGKTRAQKLFASVLGIDQRELVKRISTPTLLIHGTADLIVPIFFRNEVRKLIPGAEAVTLTRVGHVPTLTQPGLVCDAIDAFVGA
ncbi:MAG: alpha/beta fold hydrolase [Acidimicrobiales bacterium]